MFRNPNRDRSSLASFLVRWAGLFVILLMHVPSAFSADRLPLVVSKPLPSTFPGGAFEPGGTWECQTHIDRLMENLEKIDGDARDDILDSLNRFYPCEGRSLEWLGDLESFVADFMNEFGDKLMCLATIVAETDSLEYDDLVDTFYANGSCFGLPNKYPVECDIRAVEYRDPDWNCVQASHFSGSCISTEDLESAFSQPEIDRCLTLDAPEVHLCEGDTTPLAMTVVLVSNDVSLDCHDRILTGMDGGAGIRALYERSISNVEIRGCNIENPDKYGIDLKRFFRGDELNRAMRGHRDIKIERTTISSPGNAGIYVGQNSERVTIDRVTIDGADVAGIYLEAGSIHTHISGGSITNTLEKSGGADPGAAIAIDSSQYNTIEGMTFSGNSGGDIKLYKNCGETYGQICPIRRRLDASHNTIRDNLFENDVRVASRQYKLNGPRWCEGLDVGGFWRDHSSENLIYSNRFAGSRLDIQDGPNNACGNDFVDGSLELGKAVAGFSSVEIDGVIAENTFDEGSIVRVEAVGGLSDLQFVDNRDSVEACLAMEDVCAFNSQISECLRLRNDCAELTRPREVAAAEACGISQPPVMVQYDFGNELEQPGNLATPVPPPVHPTPPPLPRYVIPMPSSGLSQQYQLR